ncbi:ribosome biogenesis GTPase Der [Patescibacteria group bacterium]|nr:ribosome biogenesis GTPase Der [Patescibacteria group bacterium]
MTKIALIGQVNVGKSTLFNRLIEEKKAIITNLPGTTRDRNYGICKWRGNDLIIIDTGGIEIKKGEQEILDKEIKKQIDKAITEVDLIFFIIENRHPVLPISNFEQQVSKIIKKSNKPAILILNKSDNPKKRMDANSPEWLNFGFKKPVAISAINGGGVGDLLDESMKYINKDNANMLNKIKPANIVKVSIIGKPNVGKSTLLNALLGEEKVITSPTPNTTRGPQDTLIKVKNTFSDDKQYEKELDILLIDTAGIRRKAKVKSLIERIGTTMSLKMIKKSDIILMVLDSSAKVSYQDKTLVRLISERKKALIVVVNKCDLWETKGKKWKAETPNFTVPTAKWTQILFVSAKTGENVKKIFKSIFIVRGNQNRQINEKELNNLLKDVVAKTKLKDDIWEKIKIFHKQTNPHIFMLKMPPKFIRRKLINDAQMNVVKKAIRQKWDFSGIQIEIRISKY